MDGFAETLRPMLSTLKETEVSWVPWGVQSPDRKDSQKNREKVQQMLSAMFLHKYPEENVGFVIGWDPVRRQYRIGLHRMRETPKTDSVLEPVPETKTMELGSCLPDHTQDTQSESRDT